MSIQHYTGSWIEEEKKKAMQVRKELSKIDCTLVVMIVLVESQEFASGSHQQMQHYRTQGYARNRMSPHMSLNNEKRKFSSAIFKVTKDKTKYSTIIFLKKWQSPRVKKYKAPIKTIKEVERWCLPMIWRSHYQWDSNFSQLHLEI